MEEVLSERAQTPPFSLLDRARTPCDLVNQRRHQLRLRRHPPARDEVCPPAARSLAPVSVKEHELSGPSLGVCVDPPLDDARSAVQGSSNPASLSDETGEIGRACELARSSDELSTDARRRVTHSIELGRVIRAAYQVEDASGHDAALVAGLPTLVRAEAR
jgi:peroxiredoxin